MLVMIDAVSLPDCALGGEVPLRDLPHTGGHIASNLRRTGELCW